jgi:NSS family neurotransmitter:Na+ symporter
MVAFPVMASKNGGAAFLIVYLLFIALLCYPVMMSEIAMGRRTQRNPVGAFPRLPGPEVYGAGQANWLFSRPS